MAMIGPNGPVKVERAQEELLHDIYCSLEHIILYLEEEKKRSKFAHFLRVSVFTILCLSGVISIISFLISNW